MTWLRNSIGKTRYDRRCIPCPEDKMVQFLLLSGIELKTHASPQTCLLCLKLKQRPTVLKQLLQTLVKYKNLLFRIGYTQL